MNTSKVPASNSIRVSHGFWGFPLRVIGVFYGPFTWRNTRSWLIVISLVLVLRWGWIESFKIPSPSMEPTLYGDARLFRGDRVAVNKYVYGLRIPFMNKRLFHAREPQRGDIVVFRTVEENSRHNVLIKRLVGLPGEHVQIGNDGVLYINDKPWKPRAGIPAIRYTRSGAEGPIRQKLIESGMVESPMLDIEVQMMAARLETQDPPRFGLYTDPEYSVVPPGHYFLLGDNSANSRDGRYFGWVPNDNIVGRAVCVWMPVAHWKDFTGFSRTWWGRAILFGIPALTFAYLLVSSMLVKSWRVHGSDGSTVLRSGDRILVNRIALGIRIPFTRIRVTPGQAIRFGDCLMYEARTEHDKRALLLGSVVGIPGDNVVVSNDSINVGDRVTLPLSDIEDRATTPWTAGDSRVIPAGSLFIVDEGIAGGPDSRELGLIERSRIIGRVRRVWWPPSRARLLLDIARSAADGVKA